MSLRVVVLTGHDLAHRYVANVLCERVPVAGIVCVVGPSRPRGDRARRLLRRGLIQVVARLLLRGLAVILRDATHRHEELERVLGPRCLEFERPDLVKRISGFEDEDASRIVSALRPDVLAVYGTSIVPVELLSLASTVAVNLHTGLLPFYRGTDLDFWPLYNDELDLLGVSVHKCTARIDGGEIFATRRVLLERDDGRFTVFPRQLAVGAPLYAHMIEQILREPANGTQQDPDIGREYRMAMRGLLPEIVVRARIRRGLIRRYVDRENAAVRTSDRSS